MAKFKFRLDTLLKLRGSLRDERRAALAQAYRAEEILREERLDIEGELDRLHGANREAAGPGQVDVDRLLDARRYELVLKGRAQLTARQQQALDAEIEKRRQALVEANREVRVLETLRDKQRQRHQQEETRRQVKEMDEAAARPRAEEDSS